MAGDRMAKFTAQERLKPYISERLKPGTLSPLNSSQLTDVAAWDMKPLCSRIFVMRSWKHESTVLSRDASNTSQSGAKSL